MKKIILTLALAMSMVGAMNAQVVAAQVMDRAIGLRFGYGGEITFQQPLGDAHRLEVDLGLTGYGFGLHGVYQWVWDLSTIADGVNWYAGVGGSIGSFYFGNDNFFNDKVFDVGILGQVGIEYNFTIPLQVSLDYRPGIYFLDGVSPSYTGICLSGRYRF